MQTEKIGCVYTACLDKLEEIEQSLNTITPVDIYRLAGELDSCLAAIRHTAQRPDHLMGFYDQEDAQRMSLLAHAIIEKNDFLTRRIQGIMALQRCEIQTIKQGRETAKGYASYKGHRTGSIINSAN